MADCGTIDDEGLAGIAAALQGRCLRLPAQHLRRDFDGFAVAAGAARRNRAINNGTCKKMVSLDTAFK